LLGRSAREAAPAAGPAAEPGDAAIDPAMFGAFAPRRKRFSFFWS
jgi:hypothetical protein